MKLILAPILVLMLAMSASASPVEVSAGPYNFSFDLKSDVMPTVNTSVDEDENSTIYLASIQLENETVATVGVTSYDEWQYAGFPCTRLKRLLMNALNSSGEIQDPSLTMRTIDGSTAEVMSYFHPEGSTNSTLATYWKNIVTIDGYKIDVSKENVELISKLPQDLNENFLSTLSISGPEQSLPEQPTESAIRPADMSSLSEASGKESSLEDNEYNECVDRWKNVGYTEAMIEFSGLCDV
jgi:hypothetical protein